jgi:hypothetical protein
LHRALFKLSDNIFIYKPCIKKKNKKENKKEKKKEKKKENKHTRFNCINALKWKINSFST